MNFSERADALEFDASVAMDRIAAPSVLYSSGPRDPRGPLEVSTMDPRFAGKTFLMGPDPRLARMPDRPTLVDFFRYRMGGRV